MAAKCRVFLPFLEGRLNGINQMIDLLVGCNARYYEAEVASCRRPWVIDEGRINAVVN
jgi:hypothetical protein